MKYPISVQTFEEIVNGKYIYVDKTDLIYSLAQGHICFLSRPRRFGKSLLLSTLDSYFRGKKELFNGLKIENLENEWTEYPVFRIDFSSGDYNEPETLINRLNKYIGTWELQYGKNELCVELSDRFQHVLEEAEKKTGHKAVVLIDEYDKPILDALGTDQEQKNRDTLKGFYGTFKEADAHLRFVLLTGVTKFSQVSVFSGFNQPDDISMESAYDAICGITEKELYSYFEEPLKEMAEKLNCSSDELKKKLKKQYDGYHFSEEMLDIYNPFSILNAFKKKKIEDYWYESGTPTYLAKLLAGHNVNMQKLIGQSYERKYFIDYRADTEDPLAMLYQSGYLTIKGYDEVYNEYFLDYPNDEVRKSFVTLTANNYFEKTEDRPDSSTVVPKKHLNK